MLKRERSSLARKTISAHQRTQGQGMSRKIPVAATRSRVLALGITALLSVVAHARNPRTLADPNALAKKDKAKAPASALKPPAVRSPASFTRQTPFGEAIDLLRNSTTPPLSIIVLWKPLGDGAGVYRDTPIGIDGVAGLRVGQVLDLLMLSLSAGSSAKVGYAVDKGVITVSTTDTLPTPKPVARIHDISDLVAPPARYAPAITGFGLGYGGLLPPLGGYPANPGGSYGLYSSLSNSASTARVIGQGAPAYRRR
jgi:hypothetical protein